MKWRKATPRSDWHSPVDTRHAHASLMLQQGTHPKIVSERLGHSGVGITLNLYSHVVPGLQEQAAAGLDRLVRRAIG